MEAGFWSVFEGALKVKRQRKSGVWGVAPLRVLKS
jgi:hypothetical protein